MRVLLFILLMPFLVIIAIPIGAVLIGVGAGIIGVIAGVLGAVVGVIAAIFATIFAGIFSIGGIASGFIFLKVIFIVILVLVITAIFNRKSSTNKVSKQ